MIKELPPPPPPVLIGHAASLTRGQVIKELGELAVKLADLKTFTGRDEPTLVT